MPMASPSQAPDPSDLFARLLVDLEEGRKPDVGALCAADGGLRDRLRQAWRDWRRGRQALGDPGVSPQVDAFLAHEFEDSEDPPHTPRPASDSAWSAVLQDLAKHSPGPGRYRLRGEIARGGMGAILKVWDDDLKRSLAKKVLLAPKAVPDTGYDKSLGRFLEEAQVTAQLEHPGIVPVHDLCVDPEDGVYFTMRLVRGKDLRAVFEDVRTGADGWNRTRALGVLLKVCEAMAFAHSRGIVHRDLKPANIMVGRFGEVYVMDWGLARVLGKEGGRRDEATPAPDVSEVTTLRAALGRVEGDSPLFTQDGAVVGTPAFMPPEQARGEVERIGPRSDVYSTGAILYQLLTGRMPYAGADGGPTAKVALQLLLTGAPTPIMQIAADTPAELVAICEKAMARDPRERYADMMEFAEELRAFLEHRVVRSYRTGALPEFVKWVRRNRATAAALGALVAVSIGAASAVAWQQHRLAVQARRASDVRAAPELMAAMQQLGPLRPENVPVLEDWIASAEDLLSREPRYRAEYEQTLADTGREWTAPAEELARLEQETALRDAFQTELDDARTGEEDGVPMSEDRIVSALKVLPRVIAERTRRLDYNRLLAIPRAEFAEFQRQKEHDRLRQMVRHLTALSAPDLGCLTVMRARLAAARDLGATLEDPRWPAAIASIADPQSCPAYGGLRIPPQLGLVPLRRDPQSGLWEFLHVLSGEPPEITADGELHVTADTGIVLVLMPGGTFTMGAQAQDPNYKNYDPLANESENILADVSLSPYFLSKYEVTIGQWLRATRQEPAQYPAGMRYKYSPRFTYANPVGNVSYDQCRAVLDTWDLNFPTEAQHEFAARSGTGYPYGTARTFAEVRSTANLWDLDVRGEKAVVDGYPYTAPVDSMPANAYGLKHMLGNVREWCLEWYVEELNQIQFVPGTGEMLSSIALYRVCRGSAHSLEKPEATCRVSSRYAYPPAGSLEIGVRPARRIDLD